MSEWISVEDRLPRIYQPVLVAVCTPLQTNEVHLAYQSKDQWHVTTASGNHSDFIGHWMPLPKPPEVNEA